MGVESSGSGKDVFLRSTPPYQHPPTGLLRWLLETEKSQVVTCRVGSWYSMKHLS